MLPSSSTSPLRVADLQGPATCAAVGMNLAAACLPVEFYYGYWFSHWRA